MTGPLLFLAGFLAVALLWLGLRVLPRRMRAIEDLRAFARDSGARLDGDGVRDALRIVGSRAGRAFTVVYQADALRGDVLLVAVDCDASGEGGGTSREVGGNVVAEGEALATRVVGAGPEVTGRVAAIVDGLVEMAEGMEGDGPPDALSNA